mmetsp:Transcript_33911/g.85363  ORF Transcript_33911/g.85363 Transcript_33911/m.85363 type:complete len:252 (+) Transcript_33911:339-1094(+)
MSPMRCTGTCWCTVVRWRVCLLVRGVRARVAVATPAVSSGPVAGPQRAHALGRGVPHALPGAVACAARAHHPLPLGVRLGVTHRPGLLQKLLLARVGVSAVCHHDDVRALVAVVAAREAHGRGTRALHRAEPRAALQLLHCALCGVAEMREHAPLIRPHRARRHPRAAGHEPAGSSTGLGLGWSTAALLAALRTPVCPVVVPTVTAAAVQQPVEHLHVHYNDALSGDAHPLLDGEVLACPAALPTVVEHRL